MDYDVPQVEESITFVKIGEIKKELSSIRSILQPVTYERLENIQTKSSEPQTRLLQELENILTQARELRQDIKL